MVPEQDVTDGIVRLVAVEVYIDKVTVEMTQKSAAVIGPRRIRVNAVAPTFVKTGLTVPIFTNPEVLAKVMAHTPLGRLPEVEDIASAILYLASPAARCVTGVTLPVDSGYLAR